VSAPKHTPGPWTTIRFDDEQFMLVGSGRQLGVIIDVLACDEGSANARLISAAPELLEALQDLALAGREAWGDERPCVRDALSAIAKATGAGL